MYEICSKLTLKTLEDVTHWSGVSIVDFEQVNTRSESRKEFSKFPD